MKTVLIPVYRPHKFGASATEMAVAVNELRAQINELLEDTRAEVLVEHVPLGTNVEAVED